MSHDSPSSDPSTPTQAELAQQEYAAGRYAFERGNYRQSIEQFEKAVALTQWGSTLNGEVQIWLVTAYAALNQMEEAMSLCRQLHHHPDFETRKQSRRLLYILEAPKLQMKPEWLTQIPDLGAIADGNSGDQRSASRYSPPSSTPTRSRSGSDPEPIDLSQVNTKDNQFIWLALGLALLLIGGLVWLS